MPLDHPGITVWLTGLSGAGKSTLGKSLYQHYAGLQYRVELLDGDDIREFLSRGLGFTKLDRDENIRRIGFVAELLTRNGVLTFVSAISPYREARNAIRSRIPSFIEVYVDAPITICEERDPKGLYCKARAGLISSFTGIDDPYEPPLQPDVTCHTCVESVTESTAKVIAAIDDRFNGATQTLESPRFDSLPVIGPGIAEPV